MGLRRVLRPVPGLGICASRLHTAYAVGYWLTPRSGARHLCIPAPHGLRRGLLAYAPFRGSAFVHPGSTRLTPWAIGLRPVPGLGICASRLHTAYAVGYWLTPRSGARHLCIPVSHGLRRGLLAYAPFRGLAFAHPGFARLTPWAIGLRPVPGLGICASRFRTAYAVGYWLTPRSWAWHLRIPVSHGLRRGLLAYAVGYWLTPRSGAWHLRIPVSHGSRRGLLAYAPFLGSAFAHPGFARLTPWAIGLRPVPGLGICASRFHTAYAVGYWLTPRFGAWHLRIPVPHGSRRGLLSFALRARSFREYKGVNLLAGAPRTVS